MSSVANTSCFSAHDGIQLFYRDWGKGDPIVFLAGWSVPSDFWAYQMLALKEAGYRCIAYDRRGHGKSADQNGPMISIRLPPTCMLYSNISTCTTSLL